MIIMDLSLGLCSTNTDCILNLCSYKVISNIAMAHP